MAAATEATIGSFEAEESVEQAPSASEGQVETEADGEITTMMIRNVPRKYTSAVLTHELQETLPSVSFNFVYLPWDSKASTNLGYGFVNFVTSEAAFDAQAFLDGKTWGLVKSNKTIRMVPANRQGLVDNVRQYLCNTSHTEKKFRPVVILDDKEMDIHDAAEILLGASFVPPQPAADPAATAAAQSSTAQPSKPCLSRPDAVAPVPLKSAPGSFPQSPPGLSSGRPQRKAPQAATHSYAADLDNNWRRSGDSRPLGQPMQQQPPVQQQLPQLLQSQFHFKVRHHLTTQPQQYLQSPPLLPQQAMAVQMPQPPPPPMDVLQLNSLTGFQQQLQLPPNVQTLAFTNAWEGDCATVPALALTSTHASWPGRHLAQPMTGCGDLRRIESSPSDGAPGLTLNPRRFSCDRPGAQCGDAGFPADGGHVRSHDSVFCSGGSVSDDGRGACGFGGFDGLVDGADVVGMTGFSGPGSLYGSEKRSGAPDTDLRAVIWQSPGFQRSACTVNALLMKLQRQRQQRGAGAGNEH